MKQSIHWVLIAIAVILSIGVVPSVYGEIVLSTSVLFDSFSDDLAEETDGSEFTVPIGIAYTRGEDFSISIETAYSSAHVNQADGSGSDLSSFTDTLLSVTYTIPGLPFLVTCGVDVNLPTGKEQLSIEEESATPGEDDLLGVSTFGEGLNLGGNLSAIKEFEKIALGTNVAYVYKGEYDPTKDVEDDDLDPGDQFLVTGILNWKMSSQVTFGTFLLYSYFLTDKVNGRKDFQEGSSVTIGGNVRYTRGPLGITFSLQDTIPQKNRELTEGSLKTEAKNSNNNTMSAALDVSYTYSSTLIFHAVGDIRYYSESEREDAVSGLPYAGTRARYSFGPGVTYIMRDNLWCYALAKYLLLNEDNDLNIEQDRTYQGVNINVGVTYRF
jgi:hypothetical protein